jgi:hypothetical protein
MTGTSVFLGRFQHFFGIRQDEGFVVHRAERADPRVEQLHGLRPGADLGRQVFGQRRGQFVHESVPDLRGGVHHQLGDLVVTGSAAFDHVGSHRERGAGKADQRGVTEFGPQQADGVHNVGQRLVRAKRAQRVHIGLVRMG